MKSALLIAFHFPPYRGSSGWQRTISMARYLEDFGWRPVVLTASTSAYPDAADDPEAELSDDLVVHRGWALYASRHMAIARRHPRWLALPDPWSTWIAGGIAEGLRAIRRHRPEVLWSTCPIPSAHVIGMVLKRLTGLPWVVDFRDPLGQDTYPPDKILRRAFWAIERAAVRRADAVTVTTEGAAALLRTRYPEHAHKVVRIENGFDERMFAEAEPLRDRFRRQGGPVHLLHSGLLHPVERNPFPFFEALASLRRCGAIDPQRVRVVLRASGFECSYAPRLSALGIADLVELAGGISYREALAEMLEADGLLLFQAANCNQQIPAKLYEYIRAGRPILAMTDARGDTARTLSRIANATVVPLDDPAQIEHGLVAFLDSVASPERQDPQANLLSFERVEQVSAFARLFDRLTARGGLAGGAGIVP